MNKSEEIAKLFGLELDEEFMLNGLNGLIFKITNEGLKEKDEDTGLFKEPSYVAFRGFYIKGGNNIIKAKSKWKPKVGDSYRTIDIDRLMIIDSVWSDSEQDNNRYDNNLVFRPNAIDEKRCKKLLKQIRNAVNNIAYNVKTSEL